MSEKRLAELFVEITRLRQTIGRLKANEGNYRQIEIAQQKLNVACAALAAVRGN